MSVIKKENIVIVIGTYTDRNNQEKKQFRTIGEIVTMQGNDGPYQFGKIWGPHGVTEFKLYPQEERNQQPQQGGYQQPQQQGGYNQVGFNNGGYDGPAF